MTQVHRLLSRFTGVATLAVSLACINSARANSITYLVAGGSGNTAVAAEADFVTGNNSITLVLKNIQSDPNSVAQCLSAFFFTLDGAVGANSLASSSAYTRTVSGHSYTDSTSNVATGWVESSSGKTLKIDVLSGGAGPAHTIIGAPAADNKYDSAGGSINGNGPHNPFLAETASFTFNVAGVTQYTSVTAATFQFGTTDGTNQFTGTNVTVGGPSPAPVPLPASVWSGGALLGLLGLRSRLRKRVAC